MIGYDHRVSESPVAVLRLFDDHFAGAACCPKVLLNHRWKLGTFAGIPLLVHWSFSLAIFLVAFSASDGGVPGVLYSVAQLLGVFFCVTLHEYGHAMAARSFGIATVDITLLPIGGVARLKKMPRIPWQELIVAVAGPAVNVVIAILLSLLLAGGMPAEVWSALVDSTGRGMMDETLMRMMDLVNESSWLGYAVMMLVVNVVLVLFNMIPAFPMDGGRVFRSLLAMTMSYRRATWIASRIGLLIAVLMVTVALRSDPPLWGAVVDRVFHRLCRDDGSPAGGSDGIGARSVRLPGDDGGSPVVPDELAGVRDGSRMAGHLPEERSRGVDGGHGCGGAVASKSGEVAAKRQR